MLDADFEVTALPSLAALERQRAPHAIVLAAAAEARSAWEELEPDAALAPWPSAALVLVDAPPVVARRFPAASLASWKDPLSLPATVAAATAGETQATASSAMARALASADLALRPELETAIALAALVDVARRAESVRIAAQFLGEQSLRLVDRLAWVDWFAAEEDEPTAAGDLAVALRLALEAGAARAARRGLDFEWQGAGACPLRASPARLETLARSLRLLILEMPEGHVEIRSRAGEITATHSAARAASPSFAGDVASSLLRRARASFEPVERGFRIAMEDHHAGPRA